MKESISVPYWGSSPLARGLLHPPVPRRREHGIIPARAGFTSSEKSQRHQHPDHPRSRGVYLEQSASPPSWMGSSPLARGLLIGAFVHGLHDGIIPARAGFTLLPCGEEWTLGDHPRSRGVYPSEGSCTTSRAGSSPLARGLLGGGDVDGDAVRIIPARAGFTRGRAGSP